MKELKPISPEMVLGNFLYGSIMHDRDMELIQKNLYWFGFEYDRYKITRCLTELRRIGYIETYKLAIAVYAEGFSYNPEQSHMMRGNRRRTMYRLTDEGYKYALSIKEVIDELYEEVS